MAENESTASAKKAEKKQKRAGFFKSLKSERKKITWYPKRATLINTVWVSIALVIFSAVTALVDFGFTKFIGLLANLVG